MIIELSIILKSAFYLLVIEAIKKRFQMYSAPGTLKSESSLKIPILWITPLIIQYIDNDFVIANL